MKESYDVFIWKQCVREAVYIILQYNNQTDNEMKPETVNRYRNHTHVQ